MAFDKSDKNWLKQNFITSDKLRDVVNEIVIDASQTILAGVQTMFDEHNKENKKDFQRLETKVDNVEKHIKDDINGLKADLSDTVSRNEFNRIKSRVNKYHPAN